MAKAVDRNTLTYAYAAHPYSNATVDVPVISLKSSVSKCESPSTTTTIGFLTRDPIAYTAGSNNIYECVASGPLRAIDPSGLEGWIPGPTVGGTNYPWIPPGTVLPGHPNSSPIPSEPSEEALLRSRR